MAGPGEVEELLELEYWRKWPRKIRSGGLRVGCMKWPGLGYDYGVCD